MDHIVGLSATLVFALYHRYILLPVYTHSILFCTIFLGNLFSQRVAIMVDARQILFKQQHYLNALYDLLMTWSIIVADKDYYVAYKCNGLAQRENSKQCCLLCDLLPNFHVLPLKSPYQTHPFYLSI